MLSNTNTARGEAIRLEGSLTSGESLHHLAERDNDNPPAFRKRRLSL